MKRHLLGAFLTAGLLSACAWAPQAISPKDQAAEQMVSALRQINAGLNRFKYVGRLTLTGQDRPAQSFRAAIAGRLPVYLRIDMLAPFGGSTGMLASDGEHLFLVMHRSGEYYKRRFGNGSLRRFIHLDVSVGDLLELMAGRIPMGEGLAARSTPDALDNTPQLDLVDRHDRVRQRITLDGSLGPVECVWFDGSEAEIYRARFEDREAVGGFVLPRRIVLSGAAGSRVAVTVDRSEVNVDLDERLFTPARPSY